MSQAQVRADQWSTDPSEWEWGRLSSLFRREDFVDVGVFPLDVLPRLVRLATTEGAISIGAPVELVAVPMLASIGSLLVERSASK